MNRPFPARAVRSAARPTGSASTDRAGPTARRWLSRKALRLHAALLIVVPGCLAAGWFELTRALAGNELSWVYVFEWPLFAAFAGWMWWRLLREEEVSRPRPAGTADVAANEPADPQLEAWREYLARLHAQSPPGGPPEGF